MTSSDALALNLVAWGTVRADLVQAAMLRKQLPAWAPEGTPGHFLKHADEHTIVAVSAVDRAIREHGMDVHALREWSIIAAPRFLGRFAGAAALERYGRGGGPALSPHLIPQHSLHSVSGALSILLASRRPNLGVGGGADAIAEGLLAALTLPRTSHCPGVWLVATAWEPEPVLDLRGNCTNSPACYAAALALESAARVSSVGGVGRLEIEIDCSPATGEEDSFTTVPELCRLLDAGWVENSLRWRMPGGVAVILRGRAAEMLRVAA
jgi:hypothetical protein